MAVVVVVAQPQMLVSCHVSQGHSQRTNGVEHASAHTIMHTHTRTHAHTHTHTCAHARTHAVRTHSRTHDALGKRDRIAALSLAGRGVQGSRARLGSSSCNKMKLAMRETTMPGRRSRAHVAPAASMRKTPATTFVAARATVGAGAGAADHSVCWCWRWCCWRRPLPTSPAAPVDTPPKAWSSCWLSAVLPAANSVNTPLRTSALETASKTQTALSASYVDCWCGRSCVDGGGFGRGGGDDDDDRSAVHSTVLTDTPDAAAAAAAVAAALVLLARRRMDMSICIVNFMRMAILLGFFFVLLLLVLV